MDQKQTVMRPIDLLILLKITTYGNTPWFQKPLAADLNISQSEVSKSLRRSRFSGILDTTSHKVQTTVLLDLLQQSVRYVFPQKPGPIVRGIPTAHSTSPLNTRVDNPKVYVWASMDGQVSGQQIIPLYPSVPVAALKDPKIYELLALVDTLRVGLAMERDLAFTELKLRLLD